MDLMLLTPETQAYVLTICRQLAACDEDTIEQFQLSDGAPDLLADFVKRLKRRVSAARRRRQRAASQPKTSNKTESAPSTSTATADNSLPSGIEKPRNFATATKMFELAATYIIAAADNADRNMIWPLIDISDQVNNAIYKRFRILRQNTNGYLTRKP